MPTYETSFVTAPPVDPAEIPARFGSLGGWFADKELSCYRRLLYPVHFVALDHDVSSGWFSSDTETVRFAVDGLDQGHDRALSAYRAESPIDVDPYAAFDDPVVPPFALGHDDVQDRVEDLLDRCRSRDPVARRTMGVGESFDADRVVAGPRVTTAYVPFWVGEFDGPNDGQTYVGVYYGGETDSDGRWLVDAVLSDADLIEAVRDGHVLPDRGPDGRAGDDRGDRSGSDPDRTTPTGGGSADASAGFDPSASQGRRDRSDSSSPGGARGRRGRGDGEDGSGAEPVQPEGVEMQVEAVLDPRPDRRFSDVGGMADLKTRLRERVVAPLHDPERYAAYGLGATSGILLYGPPGCGKTYVAGALAGELGFNYVSVSPTEFASKYVGEGARKVADTFAIARANQPCLVFIDEIDGVARDRSEDMANTEKQLVNQLLVELESVQDEDVVVLAATNHVEDVDGAILRSGRFDERIEVEPPDAEAREAILRVHLDDRPLADDLSLSRTIAETAGYASSDLALVADVAARHALAADEPIDEGHLTAAVEETETSIPGWLDRYEDEGSELVRPAGTSLAVFAEATTSIDRDFDAVAGMAGQKRALRERVLHPTENRETYAAHGVTDVDGVLLYGPPECGKTYLAGALAGELHVPFFAVTPGSLTGQPATGSATPGDAFDDALSVARANEPCVLLVDDLDALAPAKGGRHRLAHRIAEGLATLAGEDVLVVGTTHLIDDVAEDVLHAGCFDERVEVPPPDADTRAAVLRATLGDRAAPSFDWAAASDALAGYAVSDVRLVAEQAARAALREERDVTHEDLRSSVATTASTITDWVDRARYADSDHGSDLRYFG